MAFDFVCVCSCGNKFLGPVFSLDGPDLTDTALILSLAGPSGPQIWIALCAVFRGACLSFSYIHYSPFLLSNVGNRAILYLQGNV